MKNVVVFHSKDKHMSNNNPQNALFCLAWFYPFIIMIIVLRTLYVILIIQIIIITNYNRLSVLYRTGTT